MQRVIVCCRDMDLYHELIAWLARDYIVTISSQLYDLVEYFKESRNQVALIEIPENEEEFLYTLQQIFKENATTRIIILDGNAKRTTIAEAFRMGVTDYFPGPINDTLLIERIGVLIEKSGKRSAK